MSVFAGLLGALAGVTTRIIPRNRITPEQRERRRRATVQARGRFGSATITDFHDSVVCYSYWIAGAEYVASQDVSALKEFLPPDPARLIARPATVKYLPRNPANSIVLCEEWSGLHCRPRAAAQPER